MGEFVIKMPDVGEGIAEAELVEWHVKVGDLVREDMVLAAVMTDKATVEIPSSVDGEVLWLGADLGVKVAIGSPLIRIKVKGEGNVADGAFDRVETAPEIAMPITEPAAEKPVIMPSAKVAMPQQTGLPHTANLPRAASLPRTEGDKPLASPSVRARAREAGIDLRQIIGSGPAGRIIHDDLDDLDDLATQSAPQNISAGRGGFAAQTNVEEIRIIGLRRKIAEKMALSKSRIPHIMYAEEIDVTALEDLRQTLNQNKKEHQPRLTILPFLMRAMVKALADNPQINARYDDEAGVVHRYAGVHVGIAAQTSAGLIVPVVKHAEARNLWGCATELNRLSEAARMNTLSRDELTGSTITISSLGAMGGLVSTPVINHPEVAIVGVNKITTRPVWDGAGFVPRKMMNLSSSFDHRVIDGWDAAVFIQRLKTLLETPALIFVEG